MLDTILYIIAAACFAVAAFPSIVKVTATVNLVALGLLALTLALLIP